MCSPHSRRPESFRSNGQSKSKNNPAILKRILACTLTLLIPLLTFGAEQDSDRDPIGHRIALSWDRDSEPTAEQLGVASEVGIDMVQLSLPTAVPPAVAENFYILLDASLPYQTISEIETNGEQILTQALSKLQNLPDELTERVAAIRLFEVPADFDRRFPSVASPIADTLSEIAASSVYYQSGFLTPHVAAPVFDFASGRIFAGDVISDSMISSVSFFEPSVSRVQSLETLEQLLNHTLRFDDSIVILPSVWFFEMSESNTSFIPLIETYLDGEEITFPKPAEQPSQPESNWPVFILFAIWVTFILHFKYQPIYRAALPRYFFHHGFFVADIGELRIRNGMPGLVVFAQHALLAGLAVWIFTDVMISEQGLNAIAYHFPMIVFPGLESVSLGLAGGIAVLLSHFISLFWLYLLNNGISNFSQIIHLYHWPLHLNLLNVSAMLFLYLVGSSSGWIIAFFLIFLLVWFLSFNIAVFDATRFLEKYRALYLTLTAGIHLIVWSALIWALVFWPPVAEPLEMAFRLP